jgi:hypothetical protein
MFACACSKVTLQVPSVVRALFAFAAAGGCALLWSRGLLMMVLQNGDPHVTGFSGQRFDITGQDNTWYNW